MTEQGCQGGELDRPGELPLLTDDLPGTGGELVEVEDFLVEEIPAYLPCGEGEHTMALVQKEDFTTAEAVRRICAAVDADPGQAGFAGLKDRRAVTRQWISFARVSAEDLLAVRIEGIQIAEAAPHKNKIRTGHLRGNRFTARLRGTRPKALANAEAALARLTEVGVPNYFGEQRFGRDGDNADRGLRILLGQERPPRDRLRKRLFISALQSRIFNELLAERLRSRSHARLLGGEVLQRTDSRGLFVSEDMAVDQRRLDAREVVITGPILGPRMPWPAEGGPAHRLEQDLFSRHGLTPEQFSRLGRLARGGRRPLMVRLEEATALQRADETLEVRFSLPAGSYATVVLQEIAKQRVRPGPPPG